MNSKSNLLYAPQESAMPQAVVMVKKNQKKYQAIKAFIEKAYQKYFNAHILVDMPILVAYYDSGKIIGAMGIRPAQDHPLYLEQYLDKPIERYLGELLGHEVERNAIVEVGNLALACKCVANQVIPAFMQTVYAMHYGWCAVSATNEIIRLFERMGLNSQILAECDPIKIKDSVNDWGTYYTYEPKVIIGNLEEVKNRIKFCEPKIYNPHQKIRVGK